MLKNLILALSFVFIAAKYEVSEEKLHQIAEKAKAIETKWLYAVVKSQTLEEVTIACFGSKDYLGFLSVFNNVHPGEQLPIGTLVTLPSLLLCDQYMDNDCIKRGEGALKNWRNLPITLKPYKIDDETEYYPLSYWVELGNRDGANGRLLEEKKEENMWFVYLVIGSLVGVLAFGVIEHYFEINLKRAAFDLMVKIAGLPMNGNGAQISLMDILKLLGIFYSLAGVLQSTHGIYTSYTAKKELTFANPVDNFFITTTLNIENLSSTRYLFKELDDVSGLSCDIPSSLETKSNVTIFCKSTDAKLNSFDTTFDFVSDDGKLDLPMRIVWNPHGQHFISLADRAKDKTSMGDKSGTEINFENENTKFEYSMSSGRHPTASIRLSNK